MSDSAERFMEIFFEVFEPLPRQGPGNRACAERAFILCSELPVAPAILDLGCGSGVQTLQLAEFCSGASIAAIDRHSPSLERLREAISERGLADRIRPQVADMENPNLAPGSFDLLWSEGALYNLGIENALRNYRECLRAGGYFAFTEIVWRKEDPPRVVKANFEEYPGMGSVGDVLSTSEKCDFALVGNFTLPREAWWDDFYTPMEHRIGKLRVKYCDDSEALAALEQIAEEPEMHRRYSDYYAYEFFVLGRG